VVRALRFATAGAAVLALSGPAQAAPLTTPCSGRAIVPDRVVTGEFDTRLNKSYVMVPFEVPHRTTAIRVKYCWDLPESGSSRHTLDLGLYEPRRWGSQTWGPREFRGWGGSSHRDVTLSAEGFSTEAEYLASPRIEPPGRTTRAFLPGPIRPGLWAAELGVAAVIPQSEGDADGKVGWRVELDFADDPAFADEPYRPARYDKTAASPTAGWYSGDFHVHAEHSGYGDATMTETFRYAFTPLAQGGAGLDFITLSDYVGGSAWGEIGRYQALHPGKLIVRSAEVITYRGHTNNHGSAHFVDYREGPIFELQANGSLKLVRGTRDPRELFDEVHRFGGWTQINHPTIFPPVNPAAAALCRGCFWEYSDEETDFSKVDAYEIATGPADIGGTQNPFTLTAIAEYERQLGLGHRLAAVGSSDSHDAGSGTGPLDAPIGEARTVLYARELSERGIRCAIKRRHTYVKVSGGAAPDLRFEAHPFAARGWWKTAIVGEVVKAPGAAFTIRVIGGNGRRLLVVENGVIIRTIPVTSADFNYRFATGGTGHWRVQLMNGSLVETVSSPIWIEPGQGSVERERCR
jgi:hypothetical protein